MELTIGTSRPGTQRAVHASVAQRGLCACIMVWKGPAKRFAAWQGSLALLSVSKFNLMNPLVGMGKGPVRISHLRKYEDQLRSIQ